MKLFLDENLSPKLVQALLDQYPGSVHVRDVGLRGVADQRIWEYCRLHDFAIASKDTDFRERSLVEGLPPKVIWLDVGNAGTTAIADLLRLKRQRVEAFAGDHDSSVLILSIGANAI